MTILSRLQAGESICPECRRISTMHWRHDKTCGWNCTHEGTDAAVKVVTWADVLEGFPEFGQDDWDQMRREFPEVAEEAERRRNKTVAEINGALAKYEQARAP